MNATLTSSRLKPVPVEVTGDRFPGAPDKIVLAYNVRGKVSGPNLLVCGRKNVCGPVFDRIRRLPSLPWLSGTLQLAYIRQPNELERDSIEYVISDRELFDGILFFDLCTDEEAARKAHERRAYWTILRKMTRIGMISGRGVVTR